MKSIAIWNRAPFIRVLLPFATGILLHWYLQLPLLLCFVMTGLSFAALLVLVWVNRTHQFFYKWVNGFSFFLIFLSLGSCMAWRQDIRNDPRWVGHQASDSSWLQLKLDENPVEKTKSFKAEASVLFCGHGNEMESASGKLIVYFKKDSTVASLRYGSVLITKASLQEIKNAGNPGAFQYKQYALFNGITHQLYLRPGDYIVAAETKVSRFRAFTLSLRDDILCILRRYIVPEKERGLAEALLIGYKDDLDKNLVQAYSNTGVVHVIAISGLHLGLIYALLLGLLKPLKKNRYGKWIHLLLVITVLWLFSFLCGASPSVLRSALMFSIMALAQTLDRHSSIYNSLAVSAFVLLCINPFWLWDVGFQLSYAAVLSIIIFMKPIYGLLYCKNKVLDTIWKLNAVTISAQLLTIPLTLYHFHQFPNYFLLTNFIAVPLSSLILIGEILLCVFSFIPALATLTGKALYGLIWLMNTWIEKVDALPFALWDGIQITIVQALLILAIVICVGYAFLEKKRKVLLTGFVFLFLFTILRMVSFLGAASQQKLIVYNVPQHQAIDFTEGRYYRFIGDSLLIQDELTRNFHLKPARVLQRSTPGEVPGLKAAGTGLFQFGKYKILLLDQDYRFPSADTPLQADLVILSHNPRIYINRLLQAFRPALVVADASNSASRLRYWKKDCDSLRIPFYDVSEKGAFVMQCR